MRQRNFFLKAKLELGFGGDRHLVTVPRGLGGGGGGGGRHVLADTTRRMEKQKLWAKTAACGASLCAPPDTCLP